MPESDGYSLVYLLTGTRAHALAPGVSVFDNTSRSLCGVTPWPGYWRGRSAVGEAEQAADMPLCLTCKRKRFEAEARRENA